MSAKGTSRGRTYNQVIKVLIKKIGGDVSKIFSISLEQFIIFLPSSLTQLHSIKSQSLYVVYNAIMNQVADILMLIYFHKMQLLKDQTV